MATRDGKKTGGRKKGTPNKRSLPRIDEALGDFDIIQEFKKLYYTTDKEDIKALILKELMKYKYPQKKAVEVRGDIELPTINIKGL